MPVSQQRFLGRLVLLTLIPLLLFALFQFRVTPTGAQESTGNDSRPPIVFATPTPLPEVADEGARKAEDPGDRKAPVCEIKESDYEEAWLVPPMAAAACVGGMAAGYQCSNVDLQSSLPLSSLGGGNGNDIWGWTDPQTGKEYALMGRTNGTAFVDISNPTSPIYLGNLPSHTGTSTWRDIKVYQNHAFIVADANGNHGMQVFNLTQLRNVSSPPVTFSSTAHYNYVGSSHNIAINEATGYAYIVGGSSGTQTCSGGLHMVNIQNPTSPTFAGCFASDGYTHDTQCVVYNGPDLQHIGKEICVNSNEDTVTVVDVTNKGAPVMLSRIPYTGSRYTHQGWLTEDHAYFLLDDELDEQNNGHATRTYVWNLSDLDSPALIGNYTSPAAAIDHNLYIKGHTAYEANYRAGLRILSTVNAASGTLSQVGYFDIYPSSDSAQFNGAWSNYPYFASGNVVVSGIEQGLFVLKPTLAPDFYMETSKVVLNVCQGGSDNTTFSLKGLYGYNSTVALSASGLPSGATASFTSSNPSVPGSSTLTIGGGSAAAGSYRVTVTATGGGLTQSEYLKLVVSNAVGAPSLTGPSNGATGVSTAPTLTWNAVSGAQDYIVEVATDAGFGSIVRSATVAGTSYTVSPALNANATYHWRVRARNGCGTTPSATFSFQTANIACTLYTSSDVPKAISASGTPSVSSVLNVSGSGSITDINVKNLNGTHTYINDLDFTLRSPAGTNVQIMARSCGSQDNFNLNLDDEAAAGAWPCPPVGGGTYRPSNALSGFDGQNANGTWTLTVRDNANTDGGSLNGWALEICGGSSGPTATAVPPTATSVPPTATPVPPTATPAPPTATPTGPTPTPPAPTCTTYTSTDVPKSISASGTPSISSILSVPTAGTITDINVLGLAGSHTYINDLDFTLRSPAGTNVQIMARSCGSQDNFNLNLDDEAAAGAWPCPPVGGGTYRPSAALSAFDGQNRLGTWTLTVRDSANLDGGSLTGWRLQICTQ